MNKTMMCVFGCLVIGMALLATTAHGAKTMKVARRDLDKTVKLEKTVKDLASFQDRRVGENNAVGLHPGSPGYSVWVDAKAPKTADTFEFDKRNLTTTPNLEDTGELGKRGDFELEKPAFTTTPGADLDDTFKDDLEGGEFRNPVGATADHAISIIG